MVVVVVSLGHFVLVAVVVVALWCRAPLLWVWVLLSLCRFACFLRLGGGVFVARFKYQHEPERVVISPMNEERILGRLPELSQRQILFIDDDCLTLDGFA